MAPFPPGTHLFVKIRSTEDAMEVQMTNAVEDAAAAAGSPPAPAPLPPTAPNRAPRLSLEGVPARRGSPDPPAPTTTASGSPSAAREARAAVAVAMVLQLLSTGLVSGETAVEG